MGDDDCGIYIMNRWGSEIYRDDFYQNDWGGTSSGGQDLEDGTYYYTIKCGDEIRFQGPVTIMRNRNN